ncbi:MAG: Maf family protein [Oscillospiraceae bacterium]|nr:Maf family protein [Oscillospiraceae bacterium]
MSFKFILASQSPRREELLALVLDTFEIIPAKIDESFMQNESALEYVRRMARRKAEAVAKNNPDTVVIGCDTIVEIDGKIFGKPENEDDAERMLATLSGRFHQVITAVNIQNAKKDIAFSEETRVEFWKLSKEQISQYVQSGECFDKAGAYAIQGRGALLVKSINGDYYNVVGLPVARLAHELNNIKK